MFVIVQLKLKFNSILLGWEDRKDYNANRLKGRKKMRKKQEKKFFLKTFVTTSVVNMSCRLRLINLTYFIDDLRFFG